MRRAAPTEAGRASGFGGYARFGADTAALADSPN